MEAPAPAPAAPPTATASAEVRAALSGFLDWVATPPGWPLRCVLAENRKNRSGSFDPAHVDFTASSNGTLPWPFGHPDEETGLFEAVATMVPAELGVRFLRRLGNTSGMSSNVYELEVLGSFRAAYKTCHLRERSPLVRERQVMPAIRAAAPQYSFEQYDVRQYEAALELAGDGGTVQDWACAPGSPAPGTPERRRWARRCNALTLDALRLIHDAGFFHADLKPQNLLLLQPDAADPEAFEVRVCDWEQDNWPARDAACGPARSRLRDNLMLARCVCAVYCDLCAFCASEQLRKRRSFFHWNQDMTVGLLRGWMSANPAWFGEDLALLRRALLLDEPSFPYPDGGREAEDWSGTPAGNSSDRAVIEAISEEEARGWVDRQERAFGELVALGCPALATAGSAEWRSYRAPDP